MHANRKIVAFLILGSLIGWWAYRSGGEQGLGEQLSRSELQGTCASKDHPSTGRRLPVRPQDMSRQGCPGELLLHPAFLDRSSLRLTAGSGRSR